MGLMKPESFASLVSAACERQAGAELQPEVSEMKIMGETEESK